MDCKGECDGVASSSGLDRDLSSAFCAACVAADSTADREEGLGSDESVAFDRASVRLCEEAELEVMIDDFMNLS